MSSRSQLAWLSLAMFLGMTLWFSATAANAPIVAEFNLTGAHAAWLTMAVQGGFVAGTLASALLNLPDVLDSRRLFFVGCLAGALANASLTRSASWESIVVLRAVTGVALAWVYPPGMQIAAGWFERRRGAALGVVIGALTVGSAFPHLLAGVSASIPWRTLMLVASLCAVAGGFVVLAFVSDGPFVVKSAGFEPGAVLRVFASRPTRLATLGYLGHMWELYAVWTWIAAFASVAHGAGVQPGSPPSSAFGSAIAFVTIASGALGSVAAGLWADGLGNARVASWAMKLSAACCVVSGFAFIMPAPLLTAFAVVWGVAVVADSAQLSALVAQFSPPSEVGSALTIQTCAGFLLTMVSIRLVPIVADAVGWRWAFLALVPGPVSGALALRGLYFVSLPARGPRLSRTGG